MGAGQSLPEAGKTPPRGLHVLRVTQGSPASLTNLEPFFDFIVGYEDITRTAKFIEAHEFESIVEQHEGRLLHLIVWSSKGQNIRHISIVPSREWSQPQQSDDNSDARAAVQPSLLGLSMRVCEPEFSLDNVWHVLDVLEDSPAESAGLVPYGDWIVGWSGGVLAGEGDFYDLVEAHEDKPLRVYVYSYDFNTLREVVLVPNRQWGGEGLLGCVFGYGLLHRIPPVQEESIHEDSSYDDAGMFVPADADDMNDTVSSGQGVDSGDTTAAHKNSPIAPPKRRDRAQDIGNSPSVHYLDPPIQ